jgi:curli biogenesis system outer membrane secretion channel CsgG
MFVLMEDSFSMRYRRLMPVVIFLTVVAAQGQTRKRVAVMDFDYGTVKTSVHQLFGADQDIGKGITDMLVDRLVNDGTYSVIERKQLDKIIAEQNFSNSDRADASTAAKIARILGVDAIIIGSITQFGNDNSTTKVGAGLGALGRFGIGGAEKKDSKAVVQITARMVDTSTAEILVSAQGKGDSERKGVGLLGAGGNGSGVGGAGLDMKSSGFQGTIIGEATNKAVTDVAAQLEAKAANLPTVAVVIDGLVADADPSGTLILNVGSKNGLKVGDTLNVKRKVREVRDPDSGKVIRSIEDPVGTVTITQVDSTSAVGKFSGAGKPQVKDVVTNQ